MKLYLMRHAEAESGERNDPTRTLTSEGRKQIRIMGEFLVREVGRFDAILCSYFARAVDTAAGIAAIMGGPQPENTPWLEPDAKATRAWADIQKRAKDAEHVLVVTHHPLSDEILALLTGAKTDDVHFHHAHVAAVHTKDEGEHRLSWFVGPKLIERTDLEDALLDTAEALAGALQEASDQKSRKRTLLVTAYATIGADGKPTNPVDVDEGDDLYMQAMHQPGAGTISRDSGGSVYAQALETLAAGLTAEIDTEIYMKRWATDGDPCEVCDTNELAGWIPMDEDFPSGDDEPTAHPNCKCELEVRLMGE